MGVQWDNLSAARAAGGATRLKGFQSAGRLLVITAILGLAGLAVAQGAAYEVIRYRFDAGGQAATGDGRFRLMATLGQPEAGSLSGGVYTLVGGFGTGSGVSGPAPNPTPVPAGPRTGRLWLPFAARQ